MAVNVIIGDCRNILKTLPDESIHCVVTSPPYWGLRDYGVADQIGFESSIQEYIDQMVSVFCEVRRVLREDGTLWLVLGDSYSVQHIGRMDHGTGPGLKPKDLCGMPWRVALALQADGWWLRQDIIWAKLNPMPESVTDRCTKSHEYVFLLTKSEKYFFDQEAIKESGTGRAPGNISPHKYADAYNSSKNEHHRTAAGLEHIIAGYETRNKRDVWMLASSAYPEAHFATFPPKLIEPCVLAGTSAMGCCAICGSPWIRQKNKLNGNGYDDVIWSSSCSCDEVNVVPCTVLDPFAGSGTVGLVANSLERNAVLIELNPEYKEMIDKRIGSSCLGGIPLQRGRSYVKTNRKSKGFVPKELDLEVGVNPFLPM